jgi:DNA (cytosine-5)-methyltransferase 1
LAVANGGESGNGQLQPGGGLVQQPKNEAALRVGNTAIDGRLESTQETQGGQLKPVQPGWAAFELLPCTDGKSRRIEPGSFPLAHGVSGRVGLLRGYGNAIVPQLAAEFIQAACESFR